MDNGSKINRLKDRLLPFAVSFTITFVFILLATFVYSRGQDVNWDLLNYHYYTGYAIAYGRYSTDIAAAGMQTYLNPIVNTVAYYFLRYLPFPFSGWVILFIQFISMPAIFIIIKDIGKEFGYHQISATHILAFLLCVISPLWLSELGTTFSSSWTAPLVIWSMAILIRDFSNQYIFRCRLIFAGIMLGFATGLKLTNMIFAVSATITLIYLLSHNKHSLSIRKFLLFAMGGILGFLLTAWWNVYLWYEWGNPIFPLYNATFQSPYYDLVNFRDMRWKFNSFSEFINFLGDSALGTSKTSEIEFSDFRFLSIFVLIPISLLFRMNGKFTKKTIAVVIFIISSFSLWALMFAYQRYLIPIELLFGVLIFILVLRIFKSELMRILVLLLLFISSVSLIIIPDWGHTKPSNDSGNLFSTHIPQKLSFTPAKYIIIGVPMSYILPSLHKDSLFYGVNTSGQINKIIQEKIHQTSNLPLRFLTDESSADKISEYLKNYNSENNALECSHFKTSVGRYVICELVDSINKVQTGDLVFHGNFAESSMNIKGVLWIKGLSVPEKWGIWSDSSIIKFKFNCLPKGNYKIIAQAHAFGPNIGKPTLFSLGGGEASIIFQQIDDRKTIRITNQNDCADELIIHIPSPVSPMDLGQSEDRRKLGIGLVDIKMFKE
ncbi:phosphoglycerol transferase I [Yersinia aldovae]|uniref:glycosyltransferase family 87 protein n=1 Tax=Yersinia aldovae TaxID=29483 RepID=UPI0005E50B0F|nr:glycosyltransferase family 87 protein [Yersinia aldovae]CNH04015.1 phosphoglycerol transferase I [Yersinia aldovae]